MTQYGMGEFSALVTLCELLARRSYHLLRELGPAALEPIDN